MVPLGSCFAIPKSTDTKAKKCCIIVMQLILQWPLLYGAQKSNVDTFAGLEKKIKKKFRL